MPGDFVIPFPFIPEVLQDLIVQGSICFKGRLFSTTKPCGLCSPLPVGNCIVRKFGAHGSGGILPLTHLPPVARAEVLPGACCQLRQPWRRGGRPSHLQWLPRGSPAQLCSEFLHPSPSQAFPAAAGTRHRQQTEQGRAKNLGNLV